MHGSIESLRASDEYACWRAMCWHRNCFPDLYRPMNQHAKQGDLHLRLHSKNYDDLLARHDIAQAMARRIVEPFKHVSLPALSQIVIFRGTDARLEELLCQAR